MIKSVILVPVPSSTKVTLRNFLGTLNDREGVEYEWGPMFGTKNHLIPTSPCHEKDESKKYLSVSN